MTFQTPISFKEALASRAVKTLLPTTGSSAQIAKLAAPIRERATFSAKVTDTHFLSEVDRVIGRILAPEIITDPASGTTRPAEAGEYMDPATARVNLKQALEAIAYQPEPGKEGSLQDLSSDIRLNLIIDMNEKFAHGYGNFMQTQDSAILDMWPAQELFRAEERDEPRDWYRRWISAGGKVFQPGDRMIALKNSDIWTAISAFNLPYPPFDYSSGMDVRDIDRDEAISLGLIDQVTQIEPQSRGFNEDLKVSAPDREDALFRALEQSLGDSASLVDGVLVFRPEVPA